jgi:hypothetical protein
LKGYILGKDGHCYYSISNCEKQVGDTCSECKKDFSLTESLKHCSSISDVIRGKVLEAQRTNKNYPPMRFKYKSR